MTEPARQEVSASVLCLGQRVWGGVPSGSLTHAFAPDIGLRENGFPGC